MKLWEAGKGRPAASRVGPRAAFARWSADVVWAVLLERTLGSHLCTAVRCGIGARRDWGPPWSRFPEPLPPVSLASEEARAPASWLPRPEQPPLLRTLGTSDLPERWGDGLFARLPDARRPWERQGDLCASHPCTAAQLLSLPGARLRPGGGQGGWTAVAGQQRPRPGSALSRSRLCRASAAQGAFGKGFRGRSGSGLGRPARPLSLCAFPRPAPGPGACGGHSLPARQPDSLGPDCVLSRTRRGASDDVLDLPPASVSFPFIGDSNSTYPSGGVRVE